MVKKNIIRDSWFEEKYARDSWLGLLVQRPDFTDRPSLNFFLALILLFEKPWIVRSISSKEYWIHVFDSSGCAYGFFLKYVSK